MKRRTLATLMTAHEEPDYVTSFQTLADVNIALRKEGPKSALLVRKAILELDLANYQAARRSCEDALVLEPDHAEANYYLGMATTLLACVKAGATAACAGHRDRPDDTVGSLLEGALEAFQKTSFANPEDPEAARGAMTIEKMLEQADGKSLSDALVGATDWV